MCFSCVKQKKMPATDEITSYHENQITPKQTILATDFQWIFKEQFSFKFQDNLKIQNKYYVLKCESYTTQNWKIGLKLNSILFLIIRCLARD